ncbi:hypothetical protein KO488_12900 [Poseidonibacter lekithochrous]|uniref:hypothetical protein n=1 Tax=Poseidonibacter TaxID=2321187 RepID=UPI001C09E09B|nr:MULTISPECIES: hypothetical protein [Poseidonibacter]MBU3015661.1 hypothetical protein [Poseidonibacter lekithochrous]MDO6828962.1 hypothetical protein [Poseidonibacter sp. 1_MG-2023]
MNGFIYPSFNFLISILYFTNLVEFFKFIAKKIAIFNSNGEELTSIDKIRKYSIFAIDIYQVFKWSILIIFWIKEYNNPLSKYFIFYLLYSNLFVYFYYHTWGSKYKQRVDDIAIKKNFINYMLAIAFYLFCYAYLYKCHYSEMILINDTYFDILLLDNLTSIYLSVSTAFTLTYSGIQPLTQEIRILFLSEVINTFIFLTIIITNSIPKTLDKGNT